MINANVTIFSSIKIDWELKDILSIHIYDEINVF